MNNISTTLNYYLNYCETEKRLSADTCKAYRIDLTQFNSYLLCRDPNLTVIQQIDKTILLDYIATLNSEFEAKTVKRKVASLRGLFYFLEEEDIIEESPFNKIHLKIKEPQTLPEVMSLGEIKKILTSVYDERNTHSNLIFLRDIAILEILFSTGIRVSELCNLGHSDFGSKQSIFKIIGKGNKERHVYIGNQEVLDALKRYMKAVKAAGFINDYVFLNRYGSQISSQAVRNLVKKYKELSGIKKNITPHAFRHSFASLLLEEGVDIKYIQEFLGHSSINTTQIYLHISGKSAKNVLRNRHPRKKLSFAAII